MRSNNNQLNNQSFVKQQIICGGACLHQLPTGVFRSFVMSSLILSGGVVAAEQVIRPSNQNFSDNPAIAGNPLRAERNPSVALRTGSTDPEQSIRQRGARQGPGQRPGPGHQSGSGSDNNLDLRLAEIIDQFGIEPVNVTERVLPDIADPLPQLGKKLFFSTSLGGGFDAACVTCHHPALGGADGLSLSVGVEAVEPNLLGPGRESMDGLPPVPRNAPTVFNLGFWDTGLFWDTRVESLGKEPGANGSASGIDTPDSERGVADPDAGANLAAAQARFPVTSDAEMKTPGFETGASNDAIRGHLAARIGNYGVGLGELDSNLWLEEFQQAFGVTSPAEELITYDAIGHALGEYERSMVFVDSPWQRYLEGDTTALSNAQKRGAILFFSASSEGGAGCAACHNGPLLSDGLHHTVAFPQYGPGKSDGNNDDFGREKVTGDEDDRYRYRTPGLLNVALTAPYGHAGTYETLGQVVRHYVNPRRAINNFFADRPCPLAQFSDFENCGAPYPDAEANSNLALDKLLQEQQAGLSRLDNPGLNQREVDQLVAFMHGLTDSCAADRECLAPWVADPLEDNPDGQVLTGVDSAGNAL